MALYQSDHAKGIKMVPNCKGSEIVSVRVEFLQSVALALNDIIEMLPLPEDHVPVDFVLDSDDLDSNGSPVIALSIGILNAAKTDIDTVASGGAAWLAATAAGVTPGLTARLALAYAMRMQPQGGIRRSIGIKCTTAPATGVATLTNLLINRGKWQPLTLYAANDFVTLPNGVRQKCTTGGISGAVVPQFHALYNNTTADGAAVWTTADPVIGLTMEMRSAHFGS